MCTVHIMFLQQIVWVFLHAYTSCHLQVNIVRGFEIISEHHFKSSKSWREHYTQVASHTHKKKSRLMRGKPNTWTVMGELIYSLIRLHLISVISNPSFHLSALLSIKRTLLFSALLWWRSLQCLSSMTHSISYPHFPSQSRYSQTDTRPSRMNWC